MPVLPVWVMWVLLLILMLTRSTGTWQNIPSVLVVRVLRLTIPLGCASWSTISTWPIWAGYYRIGDYGALSGSLRYFSLGEVYTSDAFDMTVKPYEMSLDVAYSRMLSENFSLGVGLRWIYSDLRYDYSEDSKPASAFAADIAMYYNNYVMLGSRECQLSLGATLQNMGSKISYYGDEESQFIPANLRIGASLMIPVDEYNRFSISADANKLLVPTVPRQEVDESNSDYQDRVRREYSDVSSFKGMWQSFTDAPGGFKEELQEVQWSLGAEYVYNDKFSIRAGYHHESESKGNRKYFTVGGGFRMSVFSLDVGYVISTAQSNPLTRLCASPSPSIWTASRTCLESKGKSE